MKTITKKYILNLCVFMGGFLVALFVCEIIAGIYLNYQNRQLTRKHAENILTRPPMFEDIFTEIGPRKYGNKPYYTVNWSGVEYRTDSLGCRINPGRIDSADAILFISDSMVFGLGLPDSLTIPFLLQRELNNHYNVRRVRVINGGVIGYDMALYLYQVKRLFPIIRPKLIIIGIAVNDLYPTEDPFNYFTASQGDTSYVKAPQKTQDGRRFLQYIREKKQLLYRSSLYYLWKQTGNRMNLLRSSHRDYSDRKSFNLENASILVDEFIRELRDHQVAYAFVYFPEYRDLGRESDFVYVRILKNRNQPLLDISCVKGLTEDSYFYKKARVGNMAVEPQMHFNAVGSRIVSREIADWLVAENLWH